MGGVATTGTVRRSPRGELAQVVELILDNGLVIDVVARVSVIGLELVTIQARIVVAGVDTYLRYADAVGRLERQHDGGSGLGQLLGGGSSSGTPKGRKRAIAAGALEGGKEWLDEFRQERRARREDSR